MGSCHNYVCFHCSTCVFPKTQLDSWACSKSQPYSGAFYKIAASFLCFFTFACIMQAPSCSCAVYTLRALEFVPRIRFVHIWTRQSMTIRSLILVLFAPVQNRSKIQVLFARFRQDCRGCHVWAVLLTTRFSGVWHNWRAQTLEIQWFQFKIAARFLFFFRIAARFWCCFKIAAKFKGCVQ